MNDIISEDHKIVYGLTIKQSRLLLAVVDKSDGNGMFKEPNIYLQTVCNQKHDKTTRVMIWQLERKGFIKRHIKFKYNASKKCFYRVRTIEVLNPSKWYYIKQERLLIKARRALGYKIKLRELAQGICPNKKTPIDTNTNVFVKIIEQTKENNDKKGVALSSNLTKTKKTTSSAKKKRKSGKKSDLGDSLQGVTMSKCVGKRSKSERDALLYKLTNDQEKKRSKYTEEELQCHGILCAMHREAEGRFTRARKVTTSYAEHKALTERFGERLTKRLYHELSMMKAPTDHLKYKQSDYRLIWDAQYNGVGKAQLLKAKEQEAVKTGEWAKSFQKKEFARLIKHGLQIKIEEGRIGLYVDKTKFFREKVYYSEGGVGKVKSVKKSFHVNCELFGLNVTEGGVREQFTRGVNKFLLDEEYKLKKENGEDTRDCLMKLVSGEEDLVEVMSRRSSDIDAVDSRVLELLKETGNAANVLARGKKRGFLHNSDFAKKEKKSEENKESDE